MTRQEVSNCFRGDHLISTTHEGKTVVGILVDINRLLNMVAIKTKSGEIFWCPAHSTRKTF